MEKVVKILRPSKKELEKLGIKNWSAWECEPSVFDWEYPATEVAYVFKGQVKVKTESGQVVEIKGGDLVTFPRGLKCTWQVIEPVKKVYRFE